MIDKLIDLVDKLLGLIERRLFGKPATPPKRTSYLMKRNGITRQVDKHYYD